MGWIVEEWGFDFRQGQEIFLLFIASTSVLGFTQVPIRLVPGALSPSKSVRT
jgi:hypothetical protein